MESLRFSQPSRVDDCKEGETMHEHYDLIIAGGGLAGGLLAYRLSQLRPNLRFLLIEQEKLLGGNHTWSFHTTDLTEKELHWITPFISKSWKSHQIQFSKYSRTISSGYHSVRSENFHKIISAELGAKAITNCLIKHLSENEVLLQNERKLKSSCVIDARGFRQQDPSREGYPQQGFQKFLGFDVTLENPHGLAAPTLMDATCPQEDGFRFFYLLPWTETSLLIEDTRYSDSPTINLELFTASIHSYAQSRKWKIQSIERKEFGVLPIPFKSPVDSSHYQQQGVPKIGTNAGFFHPTTGYSLAHSIRLADQISAVPALDSAFLCEFLHDYAMDLSNRMKFHCLLNRMLFLAANPSDRYKILEKLYRLPDGIVARFYADQLSNWDCFRILFGKPPVPLRKAIECLYIN